MSTELQLNPAQHEAVNSMSGPLLVVAGAGSGKTRVIVEKIRRLVDNGIKPFHILALTFTNKAANEMKQRVAVHDLEGAWIGTFHSMAVRILRREAHHLGISEHFSIFDADDQTSVIRSILKERELDPEEWKPTQTLARISQFKGSGIDTRQANEAAIHYRERILASIYTQYEKALATNQALDFDDLLIKTLHLFSAHPAVLANYQDRFQYILVDEYQDTNNIQYQLIQNLSRKSIGITLTGDPDQSIYSWRGADINNILNFQRDFSNAMVIKLEQNYRSTRHILNLSNQLIRHNSQRYPKELNTQNADGLHPVLHEVDSAEEEAQVIARLIAARRATGVPLNEVAVFYRTNAQSRHLEEGLRQEGLPYLLIGGVRFFDRMEVKDLIAYLRFIFNPRDSVSLMRIINKPTRGISETTKARIRTFADDNGLSCWEALVREDFLTPLNKRTRDSVEKFKQLMADFFEYSYASPDILLEKVVRDSKILEAGRERESQNAEEEQDRMDNMREFMSYAVEFCQRNPGADLGRLLEEIALVADRKDGAGEGEAMITLMTLHAAKGLEFPHVYIAGLDEGLLPHQRSIDLATAEAIEEERRLCYVGLTRAQRELQMFHASQRYTFKGPRIFKRSRFISEMLGDHLSVSKDGSVRPAKKSVLDFFKPAGQKFNKGRAVRHPQHGKGVILDLQGQGDSARARIYFDRVGERTVHLGREKLELL